MNVANILNNQIESKPVSTNQISSQQVRAGQFTNTTSNNYIETNGTQNPLNQFLMANHNPNGPQGMNNRQIALKKKHFQFH